MTGPDHFTRRNKVLPQSDVTQERTKVPIKMLSKINTTIRESKWKNKKIQDEISVLERSISEMESSR